MKRFLFIFVLFCSNAMFSQELRCYEVFKVTIYSDYTRISHKWYTPNDVRVNPRFKIESIDREFICKLIDIINEIDKKKVVIDSLITDCQMVIDFESCSFGRKSYCFEFKNFSLNDDVNRVYSCDYEDVKRVKSLFTLIMP
ncbi:MAG: hypothetical protein PHI36_05495 [Bacteroidales bacterium]|nr:hypothetical protein [Bacteroidales bacterium]